MRPSARSIRVPLREGRTLHHDVNGRQGAGKVILRAAPPGTGIIAGGPMRAVFETLGMQDVVAKSQGSSNPYNMVRATFDALKNEDSPRSVAARRNLKVSTLQAAPPATPNGRERRARGRRDRRGMMADKTDHGRADGSPIRRAASARDADRSWPEQDRPHASTLAGHPRGARHDRESGASRSRRRTGAEEERR